MNKKKKQYRVFKIELLTWNERNGINDLIACLEGGWIIISSVGTADAGVYVLEKS